MPGQMRPVKPWTGKIAALAEKAAPSFIAQCAGLNKMSV